MTLTKTERKELIRRFKRAQSRANKFRGAVHFKTAARLLDLLIKAGALR